MKTTLTNYLDDVLSVTGTGAVTGHAIVAHTVEQFGMAQTTLTAYGFPVHEVNESLLREEAESWIQATKGPTFVFVCKKTPLWFIGWLATAFSGRDERIRLICVFSLSDFESLPANDLFVSFHQMA